MAKKLFDETATKGSEGGAEAAEQKTRALEQFQETMKKVAEATTGADSEKLFKELMEVRLPDIEELNKVNQKDVSLAVKALQELFKQLGVDIEGLMTYNDIENKMLAKSSSEVQKAKKNLEDAEKVADNWWTNLFGRRESRIKNANDDVKAAELIETETKQKVELMKTQRIENFTVNDAGLELVANSRKAAEILQRKVEEGELLRDELETHRVFVTEVINKSNESMNQREEKRDKIKVDLDAAVIEIGQITDTKSEEYTEAEKRVSNLSSQWDAANAEVKQAEAVLHSKRHHLPNIMTRMTALVEQVGNLKALRAKLNSDTESMVHEIEADLQLLKNSRMQESASALEDVGVAYTHQNQIMATKVGASSAADALSRLQKQPGRVMDALSTAEALEKLKYSIEERANRLRASATLEEAFAESERQRAAEKGGSNGSGDGGYTVTKKKTASAGTGNVVDNY